MKQFIKLENEVLFNQEIKPNAKKIYLVLIKQRNTKTNITKITYRELEDYTNIRYQNIKEYLENLAKNLLINIIKKDKNATEIQITNNRPNADYTEIIFEYVLEKKIEDVLDYYYLYNLKKMNGNFNNIKYFTKKYNTKAKFKSVAEVFATMEHLSKQGLGIFDFNFTFNIDTEKNELPAQAQEAQKQESNNIIQKVEENITPNIVKNENYLPEKYNTNANEAEQLVKMFYEGFGLPVNKVTFNKDVNRINLLLKDYTPEQIETTVKYMIQIKCPTFNFIGSKVTEALIKQKTVNNTHNNPACYDRDDIRVIKSDLKYGRTRIDKLNPDMKEKALEYVCELFKKNLFEERYSHFEWAFKIGLDLNEELYSIGNQSIKESFYDKVINDKTVSPEAKQKAIQKKEKFCQWLNNQKQRIGIKI